MRRNSSQNTAWGPCALSGPGPDRLTSTALAAVGPCAAPPTQGPEISTMARFARSWRALRARSKHTAR
eukprot:4763802-Lingulodinium_polyedra.AAC.1